MDYFRSIIDNITPRYASSPTTSPLKLSQTAACGATYKDTSSFDDMLSLKNGGNDLSKIKIAKIQIWYGTFKPEGVVNGVQFTFYNKETKSYVIGTKHYGDHQMKGSITYQLADDEFITKAIVYFDHVIARLEFYTNLDQMISAGGKIGQKTSFDFSAQGGHMLAMFGGTGGHLHSAGFHYAIDKIDSIPKPLDISKKGLVESFCYGNKFKDTIKFDDIADSKLFTNSLLNCTITKITIWESSWLKGSINGIQLSFKDRSNNNEFKMPGRYGKDNMRKEVHFPLEEGEVIKKVIIRLENIITGIKFYTSNKRILQAGGEVGREVTFDFGRKSSFMIGTFGGYGGHLHNIGFYTVDTKIQRFMASRDYYIIRSMLLKNMDILNQFISENSEKTRGYIDPSLVIGKLVSLNNLDIFKRVLKYL
jgi:hypothetical protein